MIIDITTTLFILILFFASLCVYIYRIFREEHIHTRYYIIVSFIFYLLVLAKTVLFPIYIFNREMLPMMFEGAEKYISFYQLLPFASIKNYFTTDTAIQLVGNIILLFPFVIYYEIFTRGNKSLFKITIFGLCLSILIELYQLATNYLTGYPGHLADIDDVILNFIGVLLAIGLIAITRTRNLWNSTFIRFVPKK